MKRQDIFNASDEVSKEIPFQEQSHWRPDEEAYKPAAKEPITKRFAVPAIAGMVSAIIALAAIAVSTVIRFDFLDLLALAIALPAVILLMTKGQPIQMTESLNYYMANHTATLRAWLRSYGPIREFFGEEKRLLMITVMAGSIIAVPLGFLYHSLITLIAMITVAMALFVALLFYSERDMTGFASALNGAAFLMLLYAAGMSLFKDFHASGAIWFACMLLIAAKKTKDLEIVDIE